MAGESNFGSPVLFICVLHTFEKQQINLHEINPFSNSISFKLGSYTPAILFLYSANASSKRALESPARGALCDG